MSWLAVAEGIFAVAIPAVGLVYTYTVNKRAQYDRILALAEQSTTPPIADDRHVVGKAFEPVSKRPSGQPVKLSEAEIRALFNVLWYFERADAVYISLRPPLWPTRITRVQALLLDSLAAGLDTYVVYLNLGWADDEGNAIEAEEASRGLGRLATENARLQARHSRSRQQGTFPSANHALTQGA
jgi:hypothetical protein